MTMKVNFCSHNIFNPAFQQKQQEHPVFDTFEYRKKYGCYANLDEYMAYAKLEKSDIKGIAGRGGLSVVLDLGNDEVLKCSLENPLEFRKHNPLFDIPFLSPVENFGKTYFVREAKADTKSVTRQDCADVIRRLYEAKCEPSRDLDEYKLRQVGIFNGRAYLLDTRCAVPQPDWFSRFVYDFCVINKRVFISREVDPLDFSFKHIDETPRANLSLKKGLAKMWEVMKTNMKSGKKPFSLTNTLALLIMK